MCGSYHKKWQILCLLPNNIGKGSKDILTAVLLKYSNSTVTNCHTV